MYLTDVHKLAYLHKSIPAKMEHRFSEIAVFVFGAADVKCVSDEGRFRGVIFERVSYVAFILITRNHTNFVAIRIYAESEHRLRNSRIPSAAFE